MPGIQKMIQCAGRWSGTNRLHDPHTNSPDDTPSTATLTPVLFGTFLRFDYTWSYHGKPQEGSLLIGYEPAAEAVTAHWIDTWHMSRGVLACRGSSNSRGEISVLGSYAAPPGPDWGWRTVITPENGSTLGLVMYNITPDGQEQVAVEVTYKR